MAESLNPTPASRLLIALRPGWTRTVAARRAAAGTLVVLAGVAAFRPDPGATQVDVVVATRDVVSGTALSGADVAVRHRPAGAVPDGALTGLPGALGATLAAPVRRGEVLTDLRLLGRRFTEATAGPDARLVAVHPAATALVELLHAGDVVDVVTIAQTEPAGDTPRLVATGGVVVLVSGERRGGADDRAVLLALPAAAATAVAATALVHAVTLTVR